MHADALQPDRVEHARRRFENARGRVAFAFGKKESLHGDTAERRQIDEVGVLRAVAEAAAGRDERVLERQRPDAGGEIYHLMSSARNTGPEMHDRTWCQVPPGVLRGITQL